MQTRRGKGTSSSMNFARPTISEEQRLHNSDANKGRNCYVFEGFTSPVVSISVLTINIIHMVI